MFDVLFPRRLCLLLLCLMSPVGLGVGESPSDVGEPTVSVPEMVHIRGGKFRTQGDPDKKIPPKDYVLDDFWIGKYEVTFGQFDPFCEDTGYYEERFSRGIVSPVHRLSRLGIWQATQGEDTDPPQNPLQNYPVIKACWIDACAYCMWLTEKTGVPFRLPTQAEWEYACTAGGREPAVEPAHLGGVAWFDASQNRRDGRTQIRPVGSKKPNSLGLHDMLGNVWEWCLDGPEGLDYPKAVKEWERISKHHTPLDMTTKGSPYWQAVSLLHQGPRGNAKALRGGAWCEPANRLTYAYRMFYRSNYAVDRVGFRIVCSKDPSHLLVPKSTPGAESSPRD